LEDSDDSDGMTEYKEVTEHDRCDWGHVNAISHHAAARLVQKYYFPVGVAVDARETHRTKDAFNLVVFVKVVFHDGTTTTVIVRIPATRRCVHDGARGTASGYISNEMSALVSIILKYSTTLRNDVGCPYTLITKLPGQAVFSIWFNKPYDPVNPFGAYHDADVPSPET
jgi:hypothetical protein